MSKPESETDPWAKVRTFDVSTYGDCRMERDYYGEIASEQKYQRGEYAWVDEVDAARAAEATQHQQEVATLRAERDHQYTQAVEATQRALLAEQALANVEAERDREGAEHERTVDEFNGLADNMERLIAERDRLKAALSTAAFALDLAGFRRDRDAAYAALTPQGQSTDGETR